MTIRIPDLIAKVAKAVAAAIAAAIGGLLLVMSGSDTFADVTTVEWLIVAGQILTVFGVAYEIPNRQID